MFCDVSRRMQLNLSILFDEILLCYLFNRRNVLPQINLNKITDILDIEFQNRKKLSGFHALSFI